MTRLTSIVTVLLVLAAPLAGQVRGQSLAPGQMAQAAMSPDTVEKIVRDYLLKHPEIVVEAIEAYKRKQAALEEAAVQQTMAARKSELFDDPHSAVGGNPQGDVTLVEFFDYRCGVCKRVHPIVEEVMKRDGGIRRVYKEWPILGPESMFASRAAIASRRQGEEKYLSFHNAMMEHRGALNRDFVLRIATTVGLDAKRLVADLMAPEVERVIRRNFALAEALRLNGTPSFVIGDTVLRGGRDAETLLSIVREARKKE